MTNNAFDTQLGNVASYTKNEKQNHEKHKEIKVQIIGQYIKL